MKKCPFCAEEIQDDALKCRHCGEMLTTRQTAVKEESQQGQPSFFGSLSVMFWLGALLGSGGLGYVAMRYFQLGDSVSGYKAIAAAVIFAVLSPFVWAIADRLRRYAAPSMYFGSGFFDMIGKRFFWTYGPQFIALGGIVFAMFIYIGKDAKKVTAAPAASTTQEQPAKKQSEKKKSSPDAR